MKIPELRRFEARVERTSVPGYGSLGELIARIEQEQWQFPKRSAPRLVEQLKSCEETRPGRLICSLLDGDPDLPLQSVLGAADPARIVQSIAMLAKLTGIGRCWLILDTALASDWTRQLCQLAGEARVRCIFIRNDYPQSDPTLLLYTLLSRRLRPGALPTEQNILLIDGVSAWRLASAEGAAHTPWAIRDLVGNSSHYAVVPTSWRLEDAIKELGIVHGDRLIRVGDPLRDIRVKPETRIDGSEVTVHLMRPERAINPDPCVRCGWCVEGCPVRIQPAGLLEAAQRKDAALAEHFGLHACIECGICAYVCPSRLPLLEGIRSLR